MFYELNSWDPAGSTPWKRSENNPENGTFAGDESIFAQLTLYIDPDAEFRNVEEAKVDDSPTEPEKAEGEPEVQTTV